MAMRAFGLKPEKEEIPKMVSDVDDDDGSGSNDTKNSWR